MKWNQMEWYEIPSKIRKHISSIHPFYTSDIYIHPPTQPKSVHSFIHSFKYTHPPTYSISGWGFGDNLQVCIDLIRWFEMWMWILDMHYTNQNLKAPKKNKKKTKKSYRVSWKERGRGGKKGCGVGDEYEEGGEKVQVWWSIFGM